MEIEKSQRLEDEINENASALTETLIRLVGDIQNGQQSEPISDEVKTEVIRQKIKPVRNP